MSEFARRSPSKGAFRLDGTRDFPALIGTFEVSFTVLSARFTVR
jgi:hypothetical protein